MLLRSIHIIDDNETDRYLLKRLIKSANLTDTIYESENGREALEFLSGYKKEIEDCPEGYPPILIFLDINMPIMGGFEFLEEFSKLDSLKENFGSTVLTMFTSSEKEEDKERAMSYEIVKGYMVKLPRSGDELKEVIQQYFPDLQASAR